MKMKRLRGGQSTGTIPSKGAMSLMEVFLKYVMFPIIFIGILRNFITGNTVVGGILLFITLFFMFILYLTTLGADYINNPNGYTVIKAILGVLMIFNSGAIFISSLGLIIIFCIALIGLLSAIF
jgi:hypothetical protein